MKTICTASGLWSDSARAAQSRQRWERVRQLDLEAHFNIYMMLVMMFTCL